MESLLNKKRITMYCVETNNLSYHFSRNQPVLKQVSMQVPEGSIYGFLGPNGAGKTTTLRLLLGLLKKQEGEVNFFGRPFHANRIELLRRIGSFIESPSLYGHLTAAENLEVWRRIYQCPPERIPQMLRLAGLADVGKKKARHFSLGMKQRLGIAVAMINDPDVLILDEPTNGLDPQGIIEVRDLLKKINQEKNTTIVISSHLLPEVEKLATHVGIINKGSIVFEGRLDELRDHKRHAGRIIIDSSDPQRALGLISNASLADGRISLPALPRIEIAAINRLLVQEGIDVYEISSRDSDLESVFINLLNNE